MLVTALGVAILMIALAALVVPMLRSRPEDEDVATEPDANATRVEGQTGAARETEAETGPDLPG